MGEATCCFFIISESTGIKTGNRDRSVCYAIGLQYVIAGWYLKAKFTGKNKKTLGIFMLLHTFIGSCSKEYEFVIGFRIQATEPKLNTEI